ncbi:hypothetical protein XENOCAPTIV_027715 [Xenoophorus captivus]|uniref:Uncharacterized protein n=1 Tax=Xenoophorus captivus TaxID=1517983 RepID=A0ABV0RF55_9TELE
MEILPSVNAHIEQLAPARSKKRFPTWIYTSMVAGSLSPSVNETYYMGNTMCNLLNFKLVNPVYIIFPDSLGVHLRSIGHSRPITGLVSFEGANQVRGYGIY